MSRAHPASLLLALALASPAAAASPTGLWWAEGGAARVRIARCGEALCGRLVWLRSPFGPDGCPARDRENPDPGLRARPLVGIEILSGLEREAPGVWSEGRVYDPTTGRSYGARVELEGPDRLRVRGYLGFELLGRTTTWVRVGSEPCAGPSEREASRAPG